ncbi:hypothetical protein ACWIUD_03855 [Helicobacter sp. 23-1044]
MFFWICKYGSVLRTDAAFASLTRNDEVGRLPRFSSKNLAMTKSH